MRLIDADALKEEVKFQQEHMWPEDLSRRILGMIDNASTIAAIPVEWLEYMQQESLSENDRTMVGAIEAIFIEWCIYVNRLREMNRQKEQEAQDG